MYSVQKRTLVLYLGSSLAVLLSTTLIRLPAQTTGTAFDQAATKNAMQMLKEGKQIFRYDTFGSEDFWGDQLKLHQAIEGEKLGGIGPGITPKQALALGLKVDSDALPQSQCGAGRDRLLQSGWEDSQV